MLRTFFMNNPSLKPQIFAINGQFDFVINTTAVYFGNSTHIIIPVNCKIMKCFFIMTLI